MKTVINGLTYVRFAGFWENEEFGKMAIKLKDCRKLSEEAYNKLLEGI